MIEIFFSIFIIILILAIIINIKYKDKIDFSIVGYTVLVEDLEILDDLDLYFFTAKVGRIKTITYLEKEEKYLIHFFIKENFLNLYDNNEYSWKIKCEDEKYNLYEIK